MSDSRDRDGGGRGSGGAGSPRDAGDTAPEGLFEELKRRRVYKAAAYYGAAAFIVIQVAELTFESLGMPRGAYDLVVVASAVGLPIILVLSWMYDITRGGIQRDRSRGLAVWQPVLAVTVVIAAVAGGAWAWTARSPDQPETVPIGGIVPPAPADDEPPEPMVPEDMVEVPEGRYVIGIDRGTERPFDGPAHGVTLEAFAIQLDEVTVGDYREFVESEGAAVPWSGPTPETTLPVTGVYWGEAVEYCGWRLDDGRLPTEEEWEAAARGPGGSLFPWGDRWQDARANTASAGVAGPAPVGSFAASPTGIRDQIGNVWEWTRSPMTAYPGGQAPPDGQTYYVIRGGAFDAADGTDVARRGYLPPTTPTRTDFARTGFRCVAPIRRR